MFTTSIIIEKRPTSLLSEFITSYSYLRIFVYNLIFDVIEPEKKK